MKSFFLLVFVFLISFTADASITSYHLANSSGSEGNPIVIWLWSLFGVDSFSLKVLYVIFVIGISYLVFKHRPLFGSWLLLSFGIGHLLGFLTWVSPLSINTVQIIITAMIVSFIFS